MAPQWGPAASANPTKARQLPSDKGLNGLTANTQLGVCWSELCWWCCEPAAQAVGSDDYEKLSLGLLRTGCGLARRCGQPSKPGQDFAVPRNKAEAWSRVRFRSGRACATRDRRLAFVQSERYQDDVGPSLRPKAARVAKFMRCLGATRVIRRSGRPTLPGSW